MPSVVRAVLRRGKRGATDWGAGLCAVGAQARLMSHALRKITANASKCHTTIIFLNQLRMKVIDRQAAHLLCI